MNSIKNTKSLGLAIVLTLFLGPLGLFYASITGGLIMCVTPILLFALFIFGAVADSSFLLASSFILLIVFAISYWIICVIWAATAVSNHNNKVNDAIRQAELLKNLKETKLTDTPIQNTNPTRQTLIQETETNSDRPSLQDWRKTNPYSSINDYYRIYGVPQSTVKTTSYSDTTNQTEETSNKTLIYTVSAVAILLILFVISLYDKETKSFSFTKFSNTIGLSNDQKEIENQIENVYFGLINGAYTAQSLNGTTPENLPFYNSDLSTLVVMGFAPLTMLTGTFSLEPKNIVVHKVIDNNAVVSYDLVVTNDGKVTTEKIKMTIKKIGGKWKLDGQKFLPLNEEKTSKKKKKK
jgi:hypothetical protein